MAQFLTLGSHTLQADSANFKINWRGILGGTGRITKTRVTWSINGWVQGINAAAVDSLVGGVENSIREGMDLVFSLGSTMRLLSSSCLEGTHVQDFNWLTGYDGVRGCGAEGVLRRTFNLVVYGDLISYSDTEVTSYSDSLQFMGTGGDNNVPVPSLSGNVQAQMIQQRTPVWVIQTGHATVFTGTPVPATPQFAGVGYYPQPLGIQRTYFTSKRYGVNQNTENSVRWSYRCFLLNPVSGFAPPSFS